VVVGKRLDGSLKEAFCRKKVEEESEMLIVERRGRLEFRYMREGARSFLPHLGKAVA
jgi:hypothetical protein